MSSRCSLREFRYRRPWHRLGWCGNYSLRRAYSQGFTLPVSLQYDIWRPTRARCERATQRAAGG